jgi:crossover junction endodeoxyribonuclease RuvC
VGISAKQFAEMESRLNGRGRKPSDAGLAVSASPGLPVGSVVLGIDPSLRGTGWGVVRVSDPEPVFIAAGTIRCPASWQRSRCLAEISRIIGEVVAGHRPALCASEGLFFAQNLQTALIMGEARGASLAAVASAGVDIYEIAPRKVKQAIVGYGAAQKLAVAKMIQRRLSLADLPDPDAADALALALALVQERRRSVVSAAKQV